MQLAEQHQQMSGLISQIRPRLDTLTEATRTLSEQLVQTQAELAKLQASAKVQVFGKQAIANTVMIGASVGIGLGMLKILHAMPARARLIQAGLVPLGVGN